MVNLIDLKLDHRRCHKANRMETEMYELNKGIYSELNCMELEMRLEQDFKWNIL